MKLTFPSGDLKGLTATLERAPGRVGARAATAVRAGAQRTVADAKTTAPVDTGNLRASISATITGSGSHGVMSAEIGPTTHYGGYVELGTSRMAPQPYLFPAFDRNADDVIEALRQAVTEAFR